MKKKPISLVVASVAFIACGVEDDDTSPITPETESQSAELAVGEMTLWADTAKPRVASDGDTSAVEIGVRFKADVAGTITGVRFYKGTGNTGTHTGHLWSSNGTLLKSATFSAESASGWQTVRFGTPVAIAAGTTYIASYHTDAGHYAGDNGYFTNHAVNTGPLHALADTSSAHNGVYRYGASAFPNQSYQGSNYWVDVIFKPNGVTADAGAPPPPPNPPPPPPPPPPPATGDCVTKVWSNLEACGWPGPTNTGYPAGTALRATSGRTITVDGTVIDGERITGILAIAAKNVIVRNSFVTSYVAKGEAANGSGVIEVKPGASATIEHVTLDGQNATHACIWHEGASLTATANDCSRTNDGIFVWDSGNFTMQDNYLHAFTTEASNGHIDGFQTEGASTGAILHNTIDVTQGQNSAVAVWNSRRSSNDIRVEHNLMAGGGFTVYAEDYSPSEANPSGGFTVTNVTFLDNVFSTVHFGCVGQYGVWFTRGAPTDGWRRTGNAVLETGENVDTTNPHVGSTLCQ